MRTIKATAWCWTALCMTGFTPALWAADGSVDNGVSFKAGFWDYDADGTARDETATAGAFDTDSEVEPGEGSDEFYELTLRTDVPFTSLQRIRYINLEVDGEATATTTTPGGPLLPGGGSTTEEFDIQADINDIGLDSLYRFQLPRQFGLEFGLSLRLIDGEVVARSRDDGSTERREVRQVFPLIYGGIDWHGLDGLVLRAEGGAISSGGDSAAELRATAGWRVLDWLTVEAGWWRKDFEIDDDDFALDVELSGPYAGVTASF